MSLLDPITRLFELAAYRGCHAGVRRFAEEIANLELDAASHSGTALGTDDADPVDINRSAPPLADLVNRLRLPATAPRPDNASNQSKPRKPGPRKRADNDQLG